MWPLGGEPHDTSALAVLRLQKYSRYLSTLGNFAAAKETVGATNNAQPSSETEGCPISLIVDKTR